MQQSAVKVDRSGIALLFVPSRCFVEYVYFYTSQVFNRSKVLQLFYIITLTRICIYLCLFFDLSVSILRIITFHS